jgi:hypothetical protein
MVVGALWRQPPPLPVAARPAPCSGRQYPSYMDDGSSRPAAPAFPLGWGLSYTTFEYLSITATQLAPLPPAPLRGGPALAAAAATMVVRVSVRVCNTGSVAGTEVVIAYVRDQRGGARPPMVSGQVRGGRRHCLTCPYAHSMWLAPSLPRTSCTGRLLEAYRRLHTPRSRCGGVWKRCGGRLGGRSRAAPAAGRGEGRRPRAGGVARDLRLLK